MVLFRNRSFAAGDQLDAAGHVVRLAVNPRARRVSLRVDRVRREIIATAPTLRRLAEAAAFAQERSGWIAAQMAELAAPRPLSAGMTFQLFGEPIRIEGGPGRARLLVEEGRLVSPDDEALSTRALRLIKTEAKRVLTERTMVHCQALNRPLPQIALGDPRGRWGSCKPAWRGAEAVIRYSWRLALAPYAVADYVAAHECAHLIEANHGPRFWALVDELIGDPRPYRAWLKAEGAGLHAFGRE